jgi:hypothetical protein
VENIDRIRKQCLWRGNSEKKRGGNLVAWPVVMQPKQKGGAGIINLQVQNDALLIKQLNKFYNKESVPWVQLVWSKYYSNKVPHTSREVGSFWWRDVMRLNGLFRQVHKCTIGDGSSVSFWGDIWLDGVLLQKFPRLVSYARNEEVSVLQVMEAEDLDSLFILPLSPQASEELEMLQWQLANMPYDQEAVDKWIPIWGNKYTSQKFYSYVFQAIQAHPIYKTVWKSRCIPRIKFFIWLILVDRLNTKEMLQRRHFQVQDGTTCVMCSNGDIETIEHLFFSCPFAESCWDKIGVQWNQALHLHDRLAEARNVHNIPCFTEMAMTAAWELWKVRNDKVFQRQAPSLDRWFNNFKSQCLLQSVRFKEGLRLSFCVWLDAFS